MAPVSFLTPVLVEEIQRGNAILFLGAGASRGAQGPKGETAPSGDKLRDLLSDKFLGGDLKSKPLSQVAEFAKNEAGLPKVQVYIKDLFSPLQPADFHLLIPTFRWYSIITTNFDLVIERSYDQCKDRQQQLAPILRDGDQFTEKLRDPSHVLYLKLHGCISNTTDDKLPLILASEEYARHKKNRARLFRHFEDWARERPVIFCGYDVGDPNIQQILFDLADLGVHRPPYGLINSGLSDIQVRYWSSKRFVVYGGTFSKFLQELDTAIPKPTRGLAALLRATTTSIAPWLKTTASPSTKLLSYLQDELVHIHKGMATTGVVPYEFYRGLSSDWGVFQQNLDVRRRVSDDVILEAFLESKKVRSGLAFLLKGYAGSGKSVTLRRVAWDIANDFDGYVFFLGEGGLLRREHLAELFSLTGERAYIFIEDAIPHIRDIVNLLTWSDKEAIPVTLIFGARTNEWNVYGGDLDSRIENDYELRDLTEREIAQLIEKLGKYNALGRLANSSKVEQYEHFKLTAERQLLVALHDISSEKPFEEIVLDEYRNVVPSEARILYLDVCTLHRLGIGVRAGLISRVSGITFEYFQRDFFKPLEHVVRTYFDHSSRDNMYRSRHSLVADIVFRRALPDPTERVSQIIRIIRNMDVDYSSDETAFRQMIRGRMLADLFDNKSMAHQIFEAARQSGAPISQVEHQLAVFELHHPAGDLYAAMHAIERAESALEHTDRAVLHTKAAILRNLALQAPQKLVREKLREDARAIVRKNMDASRVPHPFHTMGQLALDELKERIRDESEQTTTQELRQRAIAELIRQAEEAISQGFQRFPGDEFLLMLEADLANILADEHRVLEALELAFKGSPGRSFVAVRLAAAYEKKGQRDRAIDVLNHVLAVNPVSKEAHLALAKILMRQSEEDFKQDIANHLKRSFTPGDSNRDAQFWYARHTFLYGDREAALELFRSLGEARTAPEYRKRVKGLVRSSDGATRRFRGSIKRVEDSYLFVTCPDLRTDLFAHMSEFEESEWIKVLSGLQAEFQVGFTLRGPMAQNIRLV
jgi:tetratricopeptide (TPR) repeat protein